MCKKDLLLTHGSEIICSDQFIKAGQQEHHFNTDVASHSINTALICITFYNILKFFNIKVNITVLIVAALVHDFGILGRKEKFSSGYECITRHPKDSVTIVREMMPDIDSVTSDAIASHMFPLCARVPNSKEAWLLSLADKCAACTDLFRHYSLTSYSMGMENAA